MNSSHTVEASETNERDCSAAVRSLLPVLITSAIQHERHGYARSIHGKGSRGMGPFVSLDCGLRKLARTARQPNDGAADDLAETVGDRFRRASGGTLFLDRVDMLTDEAQAKLLSLLDELALHRDPGASTAGGKPRIISAAGLSLWPSVCAGTFNDCLFYRLNVIHLSLTSSEGKGEPMKIRDVMSTPPQTCGVDTDLGAIARVMWDHDCGFVPLVDASGRVAGVITDRDICIATATRHRLPEDISAQQAINSPVHVCAPDDSISDALATMKQFKVRRLPVVDATGQLQGVISINDIVLASDQRRKPTPGEVISTMAAICTHRSLATTGV